MSEEGRVAQFGHPTCRSVFFVKLTGGLSSQYRGKCPNPDCNRRVVLTPRRLFNSIDKARREYIKLFHYEKNRIFWQNG